VIGLAAPEHSRGAESQAPSPGPPRVTIAFLPAGTDPGQLARGRFAVGTMSAGVGSVPPAQTYLDIGQGNRVFESLYPRALPLLFIREDRVPPRLWGDVVSRAADAPAEIVPGLFGSALAEAGHTIRAARDTGAPALVALDRAGRMRRAPACVVRPCGGVTVVEGSAARIRALAEEIEGEDLLVAIERPSSTGRRLLTIGIGGAGFAGRLTSDSTRMTGYVLSTDVAPTVLARVGVELPDEISGDPIASDGASRPGAGEVVELEDRLLVIGSRRGPVIGTNLLIWVVLAVLAAFVWRGRGARAALELLALSAIYLPLTLLVAAALEPSELGERLLVGIGAPTLAILTRRLLPDSRALAVATLATVLAYAVDVIVGSPLTTLSLIGPNPALGVRFFGIGNELEAALSVLLLVGVGAALATWRPDAGRGAALAFAAAAVAGVAAFGPGRFGADVGAAIVIPIGAAVAVVVAVGARRRGVLALLGAPAVALAALLAVDLVLGGDAHLSRSIL
jgi:hypothetical protein